MWGSGGARNAGDDVEEEVDVGTSGERKGGGCIGVLRKVRAGMQDTTGISEVNISPMPTTVAASRNVPVRGTSFEECTWRCIKLPITIRVGCTKVTLL